MLLYYCCCCCSADATTAIPASDVDSVVVASVAATVDVTTVVSENTPTKDDQSLPVNLRRYDVIRMCGYIITDAAVVVIVVVVVDVNTILRAHCS